MDETLILVDVLYLGMTKLASREPWLMPWFLFRLATRRVAAKAWLARHIPIDPATLPYRPGLVDFLKKEKATGRKIYLVSAAADAHVQNVARHTGLFDAAYGSREDHNLKGKNKAAFIRQQIGEAFAYAGDSHADKKVWRHAESAVLCGKAAGFRLPIPVEAVFKN
jgi:phosphoserine phosphatase